MRAMVLERPGGPLVAKEVEAPRARAGEVVLRMKAACLNYHDFVALQGLIPGLPHPRVPLSDGVGEVIEVGEGVTRVSLGDRVCPIFFPRWIDGRPVPHTQREVLGDTRDGCLQEQLAIDAEAVVRVPEHLSDVEAATLPCAAVTAWRALAVHARLRAGETVVAQGTGGVAIFALLFAKAFGARVVQTSSSDHKLARAAEIGADHGINYCDEPAWDERVREWTGGRGADVVIDNGGPATLARSVNAVCMDGHVSVIGVLGGFGDAPVPVAGVMQGNVAIKGVTVGSRRDFEDMNRAIAAGRIRPVISHTFAMDEVPRACETLQAGEHFGKIAIAIA